jgi:hypothetical protein
MYRSDHRRDGIMPGKSESEFLVVAVPDAVEPGTNLRLLTTASTMQAAEKALSELGAGTLGRVAILERKALYARRPAVENIAIDDSIIS